MFSNKDWNLGALKMLVDTKGIADRRPDSGRPHTVRTTTVIHQVEDLSLSQYGKPQAYRTVCCVSKKLKTEADMTICYQYGILADDTLHNLFFLNRQPHQNSRNDILTDCVESCLLYTSDAADE